MFEDKGQLFYCLGHFGEAFFGKTFGWGKFGVGGAKWDEDFSELFVSGGEIRFVEAETDDAFS